SSASTIKSSRIGTVTVAFVTPGAKVTIWFVTAVKSAGALAELVAPLGTAENWTVARSLILPVRKISIVAKPLFSSTLYSGCEKENTAGGTSLSTIRTVTVVIGP